MLVLCLAHPFSPLCPQTPEELDDSDFETEDFDVRSRTSVQTEDDQLIAGQSARVSCRQVLTEFLLQLSLDFNTELKCPIIKIKNTVYLCVCAHCIY